MDPNTAVLVALSMAIGSVIPILMTEFARYLKRREQLKKQNVKFTIKKDEETIEISTIIEEYELTRIISQLRKAQAN